MKSDLKLMKRRNFYKNDWNNFLEKNRNSEAEESNEWDEECTREHI